MLKDNPEGQTHFADDATLAYIADLERMVAGLTAELAAMRIWPTTIGEQGKRIVEQFRRDIRNETLDQAASVIERQDVDPAFKLRMACHIRAMMLPNPEKL